MGRSLIADLTDRATASFGETITKNNFEKWRSHWIATGETMRDEFAAQGLTKTAEHMDDLVKFERMLQTKGMGGWK